MILSLRTFPFVLIFMSNKNVAFYNEVLKTLHQFRKKNCLKCIYVNSTAVHKALRNVAIIKFIIILFKIK